MSERVTDDLTRDLIEGINALISESQRVRARLEQQRDQPPFWPDRRRRVRGFGEEFDRGPEEGK